MQIYERDVTVESAEIRQCWAFHYDGFRCEHPAGHTGDHIVTKSWGDLECATPGEFTPTAPATLVTHIAQITEAPMPEPVAAVVVKGCIACSHKHRGGECKCGCYEFIG